VGGGGQVQCVRVLGCTNYGMRGKWINYQLEKVLESERWDQQIGEFMKTGGKNKKERERFEQDNIRGEQVLEKARWSVL
jgi:hypothetical protein